MCSDSRVETCRLTGINFIDNTPTKYRIKNHYNSNGISTKEAISMSCIGRVL